MQFKQYPSYKNSGVEWLGDVPEHWQIVRTKDIFNHRKEEALEDDEIVTAFRDGQVTLRKNRRTDGFTNSIKEHGYQHINSGDLVIHEMDAFAGAIGVSDSSGKSTPVYSVCYAKNENINHHFYSHFFRTMAKTGFINSLAKGIRVRSTEFRWNESRNVYLALPPQIDQQKIVAFLNTETARIDNLIAKQEKLVELLEEQRKSIISHAVTKGLNPNAPMKDSGVEWLGEVPEGWVERKIKFLSKLINEKTSEKSNVIALENIESWTGKYIETESSFDSDAVKFKENDVLFGKLRPYLAKVYLVENQGEAVGDIYVLRPNKLIHPQYLKFFMLSEKFIDYVNSSTNGTKMPRANWDFIGSISIYLPEISIQNQIVNYLESAIGKIELIINKQISLIEKLKEYRSSIISHSVTGKIDVREFTA
ncbi:restriction endonuclease subunit S [Acinetobacter baumannii]|uniref:restriction endonuclease subunit S n=1 Tax=Acinetobacter baumannii TaxID=470 RepID=UPI00280C66DB|nr:restriction endonuclease subunit S [Acinetobacter baumannii]MDQ8917496.1 restriction endonuclease subunit S [Acinetobacter baumannii]MDQ8948258.1 restriction endonuclease subunit S [Acinetobacter baumannii]MDQ8962426.1 restriction endonuclease subunit S [Acinetobacter baumannii]MDQ8966113.1 restriction endonuclease subunit S [Acinetobacter baumannii]MDQ8980311.1 restriction endonuclease subunit S [Acinetobacter baumannii]